MSDEFCMDCGILLSPDSSLCPVCGFENSFARQQNVLNDGALLNYLTDDIIPAYYPGY